jgi:hypothetical protein
MAFFRTEKDGIKAEQVWPAMNSDITTQESFMVAFELNLCSFRQIMK